VNKLIDAYGGKLHNGLVADPTVLQRQMLTMPQWTLSQRQLCDVELLLNGGFSPLTGFMDQATYDGVVNTMRLPNGLLWPMPIVLDVSEDFAESISQGSQISLIDEEGLPIAVLTINDYWRADHQHEAEQVYGTTSKEHRGVQYLYDKTNPVYLGGELQGLRLPIYHDFRQLRFTPDELRREFQHLGWYKVVGFQTRNPMHRAYHEVTAHAAKDVEANLLIHPVVGATMNGDVDHYTRVRCYKSIIKYYPEQSTMLSLLPLAMRMAGPREALWHAIIRQNYGCSHFIIGRDHAGPSPAKDGTPFYGPYDAQELVNQYRNELGIQIVTYPEMVYVEEKAEYIPVTETTSDQHLLRLSGTELRRRLKAGLDVPKWFSYPEVITELRRTFPPRYQQGFTVFFTGLSGAGKSTLAKALYSKLMETGGRSVTLLDGDIVRHNLSSELGFSKHDRDINIQRIGFVATEITKHHGIAICAPIAPYHSTRHAIREQIQEVGGFIEIYVSTSLEVCEQRDRKGLYSKARAGIIKDFTGVSDPYEVPEAPELEIDTQTKLPDECVQEILLKLEHLGYIRV
tara:strand:+ start:6518 stop:8227 length:1710 start_codon:yes stop_codon:yes gene_type:complete